MGAEFDDIAAPAVGSSALGFDSAAVNFALNQQFLHFVLLFIKHRSSFTYQINAESHWLLDTLSNHLRKMILCYYVLNHSINHKSCNFTRQNEDIELIKLKNEATPKEEKREIVRLKNPIKRNGRSQISGD